MYCSDGSANIYTLDGETMEVVGTITVTDPETKKKIRKNALSDIVRLAANNTSLKEI